MASPWTILFTLALILKNLEQCTFKRHLWKKISKIVKWKKYLQYFLFLDPNEKKKVDMSVYIKAMSEIEFWQLQNEEVGENEEATFFQNRNLHGPKT